MIWVVVMALVAGAVTLWPGSSPGPQDALRSSPASAVPVRERTVTTPQDVADALVLLAVALKAGVGPVEALDEVAARSDGLVRDHLRAVSAAHRWGLTPGEAWDQVPHVWQPAALAWRIALSAGAAPGDLVEQAAGHVRDVENRRIEAATMRAGVLLVLPLGLAFLPSFACTTVIPVVIALGRTLLTV